MRGTKLAYFLLILVGGALIWMTVGDNARFDPFFFLRGRVLDKTGRVEAPVQPFQVGQGGGPAQAEGQTPLLPDDAAEQQRRTGTGRVQLGLPLDCRPGETCFVSKYVDMIPGEGYGDYRCGPLSGAGGKGTNFRILSYREMEAGVAVMAAADGIVQFVRDGMPDVSANLVGQEAVQRLGLGNAVLLRHSGGEVLTGYAHLKRNSVRVKEGDLVRKGQVLGMVGLSGLTESPQLYFELIVDGRHVDPFSGFPVETGCGREELSSWWDSDTFASLAYHPSMVVRIGFATTELSRDAMEYMLYETDNVIARGATQVFMHVYLLGLKKNDRVRIRITAPDGRVMTDRTAVVTEDAGVRLFRSGVGGSQAALAIGTYFGQFTLTRTSEDGKETRLFDVERSFEIR